MISDTPALPQGPRPTVPAQPAAPSAPSPPPPPMDFIDVSHHQGDVDWKAYAASGHKLAICKVSEGSDFPDVKAADNRAEASQAGVEVGLYHFADAGDATKEADYYLSQVGKMGKTEFPVLDFESANGLDSADQAKWIGSWCTEVQDKTGKLPWLYTNEKLLHGMGDDAKELTKYPLWLADYNSSDRTKPPDSSPWPNLTAWQYTETGKVPGVDGDVDGSYLYGAAPQ